MQPNRIRLAPRSWLWGTALLVAAVGTSSAFAATPARQDNIQARYEQDRAACLGGRSSEDQATCLREAAAAREDARRGRLEVENANYRRNALERCRVFSGDDAADCRARIEGAGTVSGSVAEGGILRELTKIVPVQPEPQKR